MKGKTMERFFGLKLLGCALAVLLAAGCDLQPPPPPAAGQAVIRIGDNASARSLVLRLSRCLRCISLYENRA
jgi:hypothetical protein